MIHELHITVEEKPEDNNMRWTRFCMKIGAKPLLIEASGARLSRQMMFALVKDIEDGDYLTWAFKVENRVRDAGFEILRTKVEVPLDYSKDLAVQYYEVHLKAMLDQRDSGVLMRVPNGAAVSRNLWGTNGPDIFKYFFTKRAAGVLDYRDAAGEFNKFNEEVQKIVPTVRMQMEAVVYDDNPSADKGWGEWR